MYVYISQLEFNARHLNNLLICLFALNFNRTNDNEQFHWYTHTLCFCGPHIRAVIDVVLYT